MGPELGKSFEGPPEELKPEEGGKPETSGAPEAQSVPEGEQVPQKVEQEATPESETPQTEPERPENGAVFRIPEIPGVKIEPKAGEAASKPPGRIGKYIRALGAGVKGAGEGWREKRKERKNKAEERETLKRKQKKEEQIEKEVRKIEKEKGKTAAREAKKIKMGGAVEMPRVKIKRETLFDTHRRMFADRMEDLQKRGFKLEEIRGLYDRGFNMWDIEGMSLPAATERLLFESKEEHERAKKDADHIYKFIRETMGLDPTTLNLSYSSIDIASLKEKPDGSSTASTLYFGNYHDFISYRRTLSEENKQRIDKVWNDPRLGDVQHPGFLASKEFWKQLDDPNSPIHQHKNKLTELIGQARNCELPDDFEKVVAEKLQTQEKLKDEAVEIEKELKQMPAKERARIGLGLSNFGFFVQEQKSRLMEKLCRYPNNRFFRSFADTYKRDADYARRKMETQAKSKTALGQVQNVGYLMGNILKYGRTVADFVGWTAGAPLRYVMFGAMFFSRGAEAAKEARLKNEELIAKTRIEDVDQAADQAWKIYEEAGKKTSAGESVSAKELEKAYVEQLPQDLMERLKKSPPGTAGNFLSRLCQRALHWDIEQSLKLGRKLPKDYFERRLKEFDRIIGQYGTVDTLAMLGRYAETAGKGAVAAVQIETMALLIKNLPDIIHNISASAARLFEGGEQPGAAVAPDSIRISPDTARIGVGPDTTVAAATDTTHVGVGATPDTTVAAAPDTTHGPRLPKLGEAPPVTLEAIPAQTYVEVVGRDDSVWSLSEDQLEKHFGKTFTELNEGQRTYLIDVIKDKIVADPEKYGLTGVKDIDNLPPGAKIDFSSILQDKTNMEAVFGRAGVLTETQVENIEHNNEVLREWVHAHPGEQLTSERVDEILKGEMAPPAEKPDITISPRIAGETLEPTTRPAPLEGLRLHKDLPNELSLTEITGNRIKIHINYDQLGNIKEIIPVEGEGIPQTAMRTLERSYVDEVEKWARGGAAAELNARISYGLREVESEALRIDLVRRTIQAIPESAPNRPAVIDYLTRRINERVVDTEKIYGNVFKDIKDILKVKG